MGSNRLNSEISRLQLEIDKLNKLNISHLSTIRNLQEDMDCVSSAPAQIIEKRVEVQVIDHEATNRLNREIERLNLENQRMSRDFERLNLENQRMNNAPLK